MQAFFFFTVFFLPSAAFYVDFSCAFISGEKPRNAKASTIDPGETKRQREREWSWSNILAKRGEEARDEDTKNHAESE